MANDRHLTLRSGAAAPGSTGTVFTSLVVPLGTRAWDNAGNEYIFLAGVSSATAGAAVTFNESYATTLLAPDAIGPVAIFDAAVNATTSYGWAQIFGFAEINADDVAADTRAYIDTVAGRIDDAIVAGDAVLNMLIVDTDSYSGTANKALVWIAYPSVTNSLFGDS